nr:MAG TPA: hypothetical protein [Caudoviricetes sp.]
MSSKFIHYSSRSNKMYCISFWVIFIIFFSKELCYINVSI